MTVERIAESGRVARGLRVEVTITLVGGKPVGIEADWSPDTPSRLAGKALRRYRRIRDRAIARAADRLGGRALTVEIRA